MSHLMISPLGQRWLLERVSPLPTGGVASASLGLFDTQVQALVAKAKHLGMRPPRLIEAEHFERATQGHTSTPRVWAAARDIVVSGHPWKQTCAARGASMAAVSALLRKHGLR